MSEFLQQLLNGISLGAIFALIALGYTMVYGVLRFINFAHCDVFMVGAYVGYFVGQHVPEHTWWGGLTALAVAMLVCAVLGVLIERFAYRPLRSAPTLNVLIAAIGVSLLLENLGQHFFSATPRPFPELFPVYSWEIPHTGLLLYSNQVLVIVFTVFLLFALRFIVMRTRIGIAMRALSLNRQAAALVGINNDLVIAATFALGSALAAAGGILYAVNYPSIDPLMGVMPGLKAFVAAVVGGIGSIPGAALGGLLLGVVETFVNGSEWSTYKDAIAFGLLILILIFRPAGLLGRNVREKV
ncbi:MAG TPA: branched-chain amino acid ABC transporter permease [Candidatus Didemnitutus sp.]|nr:branched-chain amino acid ABC transporter permease [Candidatus Didemnitutus sp.]